MFCFFNWSQFGFNNWLKLQIVHHFISTLWICKGTKVNTMLLPWHMYYIIIFIMRTLSPSLMSVWSVCRPVSSASWSCHGRGCTNTVWSVGVAPSSAGTVAATLPWGTSLSTTWPAQLLTMTQVLLKLPANHSQTTVRGCRLNRHRHKLQTNFHNITVPILLNYYHACFLFTAKIRVSCDRCKASFPAEDIEEHEVHIFVHIMRPIPETKHKHVLNYKKKKWK